VKDKLLASLGIKAKFFQIFLQKIVPEFKVFSKNYIGFETFSN